jgi:hypothetical protein
LSKLGELSKRVALFGPIIPKIAPLCAIVAADPDRRHFSRHVQLTTAASFALHVAIFSTLEDARASLLAWSWARSDRRASARQGAGRITHDVARPQFE